MFHVHIASPKAPSGDVGRILLSGEGDRTRILQGNVKERAQPGTTAILGFGHSILLTSDVQGKTDNWEINDPRLGGHCFAQVHLLYPILV